MRYKVPFFFKGNQKQNLNKNFLKAFFTKMHGAVTFFTIINSRIQKGFKPQVTTCFNVRQTKIQTNTLFIIWHSYQMDYHTSYFCFKTNSLFTFPRIILIKHKPAIMNTLYGLALNERIAKLLNLEINFQRSGIKSYNFEMIILCLIILFMTWSFSFLCSSYFKSARALYKP